MGVRGTALLLPLVLSYSVYTLAGWPRAAAGGTLPDARELDHFVVLGVAGSIASTGFLQLSMIVAGHTSPRRTPVSTPPPWHRDPGLAGALSLSLVLFPSLAEAWGRGDHAGSSVRPTGPCVPSCWSW